VVERYRLLEVKEMDTRLAVVTRVGELGEGTDPRLKKPLVEDFEELG
jgi:hypothetical protein